MKPGNTVTFKLFQEAITRNGFSMKSSDVSVAGKIVTANGHWQLQVAGSNDLLNLIPGTSRPPNLGAMAGNTALVEGTLAEAPKGKAPDTLQYRSIREDK